MSKLRPTTREGRKAKEPAGIPAKFVPNFWELDSDKRQTRVRKIRQVIDELCEHCNADSMQKHMLVERAVYEEVEELLLDNCPKLKPEMVLPNPDVQASRVEELTTRVEGQSARLKDLDRKIGNLVDQLQDTSSKSLRARYEGRIVELEREKDEIAEKLKGTEAELKTGAVVNLVPPKSIASGMKLVDGKRWESVVPDLQELYDAFKARKKQGKVSV